MFQVALFEPEIAGNAGSVARSCVAVGATLHLIRPLGFRLHDEALRRAGMDYWDQVAVTLHDSFAHFQQYFAAEYKAGRVVALSTKATLCYSDVCYTPGDVLLFGPESRGLPDAVRRLGPSARVPMRDGARSLNVAVSAGVVLYEAWRQCGFAAGRVGP